MNYVDGFQTSSSGRRRAARDLCSGPELSPTRPTPIARLKAGEFTPCQHMIGACKVSSVVGHC
jgi:hypothetical protein